MKSKMSGAMRCMVIIVLALLIGCSHAACDNGTTSDDDTKIDVLVCMYNNDGDYSIIAMKPDGTGRKVLFSYLDEEGFYINPRQGSIGSDGKTLLFGDDGGVLYTYNLVTGVLVDLCPDETHYETPVFSPDMKKVYASPHSDIYCIDVATKEAIPITEGGSYYHFSFTASGKIVYCYGGGFGSIGLMNSDGSGAQILRESYYDEEEDVEIFYGHPRAFPATNKIVYTKFNGDEYELRVMNTAGGGDDNPLVGPLSNQILTPSANAAGTKIAYFRNLDGDSGGARGKIIVGNYNGTTLSNEVEIYVYDAGDGYTIWRPQFNQIYKSVYDNLPDLEP